MKMVEKDGLITHYPDHSTHQDRHNQHIHCSISKNLNLKVSKKYYNLTISILVIIDLQLLPMSDVVRQLLPTLAAQSAG
jgi:hypothetical protein